MTSEPLAVLGPDTLVGAYRIEREIGRGGMATVYEAAHTVLPRRAALKIMHGALLRQPGMATRMVQEATILESLRHPGIARVFECNLLRDHRPWIAMELLEGVTLADRLHQVTALPALEVAQLLANVADVLAAAHKAGVVHRDLKPDNLMCMPGDRDYPLRVLDWGVARLGPIGRLTLDGMTPGTPIYMSPEQATGRDIAAPCDLYSLGVIAYEALAGAPPFDGRSLAEVVCMHLSKAPPALLTRCDAPPELCALVERLLCKIPETRPTAIEVARIAKAIAVDLEARRDREAQETYEALEISVDNTVLHGEPSVARCRTRVTAPLPGRTWAGRDAIPTAESMTAALEATVAADGGAPTAPPSGAASLARLERVDARGVDPRLELGITEMLPTMPKPRWTPELVAVPAIVEAKRASAPRSARDQVAGEIVGKPR